MQSVKPSNKKFGLFFSGIFLIIAAYCYTKSEFLASVASIFASIFFLLAMQYCSKILSPLNTAWFNLGLILGKISGPIVLSIIFFFVITPVALGMRFFGRDALRMRIDRLKVATYWADRGEPTNSFHNQF